MSDPIELSTDGRDLDPRLVQVTGAGGTQVADPSGPDRPLPGARGQGVWRKSGSGSDQPVPTYYDQPIVKAPPWGVPVAAYLVTGGVTGTAAALAGSATLFGGERLKPLARTAVRLAFAAGAVSGGLLLADLGRPERALHMVRVFRPTSPMSVGVLLLSGPTGAAALGSLLGDRLPGRAATVVGGSIGVPLAGYTGVLLSATAIPGWNVGATTLPPLFLASGAATTGSLLRLAPVGDAGQATVGAMTVAAQAAELAVELVHERLVRDRPVTAAAYAAQPGWRVGRYLTAASMALGVLPTRRHTAGRVAAGVLGVAGAVLTKTAVFNAGMASAASPLAVHEAGGQP